MATAVESLMAKMEAGERAQAAGNVKQTVAVAEETVRVANNGARAAENAVRAAAAPTGAGNAQAAGEVRKFLEAERGLGEEGRIASAVKGTLGGIKTYAKTVWEGAKWLTVKPVKAVGKAVSKVVRAPGAKYAAGAVAVTAAGLGIKSWFDNREQQFAEEQAAQADALRQNIAENQNRIAAAQASIANPDVPTDNAAKVEAARQQPQQAASLST